MEKPINLNRITFSDKDGAMVLIEYHEVTFAHATDAEKYIQDRSVYWRSVLNKHLFISPSLNDTLEQIEIKKVFKLTAKYFDIDYPTLMSRSRKSNLVDARRMAINICLERSVRQCDIEDATGLPHDLIIYHRNKWEGFMEIDSEYAFKFGAVEEFVLTTLNETT